jgi:hypothetical protein
MTDRFRRVWWIFLLVGPIVLFGPIIVGGESLFWGTPMLHFVPWRTLAIDIVKSGHLPLWNPYLGMGAPLLANYQSGLLYPPNWFYFLTGPAWGQAILVSLHLILAGAGTTLLMRRLGASLPAQILSSIAFSLSGYLVSRAGFLSINAAAAWLPWIIYAVDKIAGNFKGDEAHPNEATFWLALTLAMQWLAGHAQTAWYTLIMAVLWLVWRTFQHGWDRNAIRIWSRFVLGGLLAAGLAAPQLLPTLEYLTQSFRAEALDPSFALTYSFWPWRLLGLIAPDLFGSPVHGDFWGYGNYWEDAIYIGVLPLMMVGIAIRRLRDKDNGNGSILSFLGWVSVGAFVLALGDNTPIFPFLFRYVPTFDLFQAPTRWTLLLVFSLSILAGLGFDAWRVPEGRGLYWTRLMTAGAAVIGLAAWLGSSLLLETQPTFVSAFAIAGLWLVLSGLLALTKEKIKPVLWTSASLLVVLMDLILAGWGLNPSVPTQVYETKMAIDPGVMQRYYFPADLEYSLTYDHYFTFESFQGVESWTNVIRDGIPNTNVLAGIPTVNNFDPIRPDRTERWMVALEDLPANIKDSYLQAVNVALSAVNAYYGEVRFRIITEPRRAYMVPMAITADSIDDALELVFAPQFEPLEQVVIEGDIRPDQHVPAVQVELLDIKPTTDPNHVSISVDTSSGGWLVLADTWYPGWHVVLDGEEASLYPANVAFRALWLPKGQHVVNFVYSPPSLKIGAALFFIAVLAMAGLRISWKRN